MTNTVHYIHRSPRGRTLTTFEDETIARSRLSPSARLVRVTIIEEDITDEDQGLHFDPAAIGSSQPVGLCNRA